MLKVLAFTCARIIAISSSAFQFKWRSRQWTLKDCGGNMVAMRLQETGLRLIGKIIPTTASDIIGILM
jgi:hypothetical protein